MREDRRSSWKQKKDIFFLSNDITPYEFDGEIIPFKKYDKITPGKYKPEFEGTGMISLNSKVYPKYIMLVV